MKKFLVILISAMCCAGCWTVNESKKPYRILYIIVNNTGQDLMMRRIFEGGLLGGSEEMIYCDEPFLWSGRFNPLPSFRSECAMSRYIARDKYDYSIARFCMLSIMVYEWDPKHPPYMEVEFFTEDGTKACRWNYQDRHNGGKQFFAQESWIRNDDLGEELYPKWYEVYTTEPCACGYVFEIWPEDLIDVD